MRLADRIFAFWRLPAWTDAVQVMLWSMGWAIAVGFLAMTALVGTSLLRMARFGGLGGTFGAIFLLVFLTWFLVGCWFVSEAYRGWRTGHPHGKQWAIVIAVLLLLNSVPSFFMDEDPGAVNLALRAIAAAFGIALLVASLTTKPSIAQPTPAA